MNGTRVVVTGMGAISPVGNDAETAWRSVVEGRSGIRPIDEFDASAHSVRFAGSIQNFDISDYLPARDARRMDPFIHYAIAASEQALHGSGLEVTDANRYRIGVSIGSGIGGIQGIEAGHAALESGGPRKVSPFLVPSSVINMASGNVSIHLGLNGPNLATVTACTSGTHNIGMAARLIAAGDADAMLAGGTEKCITPLGVAGFSSARALSTRNDDPEGASRPWDQGRDGFVLSEGAAILMLESYDHARARGATIYAEVTGLGMNGDAYHITQPHEQGAGARECMRSALRDAGIDPGDVDYINAHGTSTQVGDLAEVNAVHEVFGAKPQGLLMSSTKSMTGHLLGAAGGIEAVFSVLALRDQVAPPTMNLEEPEPACAGLDLVPGEARSCRMRHVLSNSFGFGGTNGSLLFSRID